MSVTNASTVHIPTGHDTTPTNWDVTSAIEIDQSTGEVCIQVKGDGRGDIALLAAGRHATEADAAASTLRALSDAQLVLNRALEEAFRLAVTR